MSAFVARTGFSAQTEHCFRMLRRQWNGLSELGNQLPVRKSSSSSQMARGVTVLVNISGAS